MDLLEYLQLDLTANHVKLRQLCMDSLEYSQLDLAVDYAKLTWTYWNIYWKKITYKGEACWPALGQ